MRACTGSRVRAHTGVYVPACTGARLSVGVGVCVYVFACGRGRTRSRASVCVVTLPARTSLCGYSYCNECLSYA